MVPVPTDDLLSKEYAKKRREELFRPNKVRCSFLLTLLLPMHVYLLEGDLAVVIVISAHAS